MGEISYRNSPLRLKITSFIDIDLVQAILKAKNHIGVYVFHILRPCLLKFRTEDVHKNRDEIQLDCSFEYNLAMIKFSGNYVSLRWKMSWQWSLQFILHMSNRFRCSSKAVASTDCWTAICLYLSVKPHEKTLKAFPWNFLFGGFTKTLNKFLCILKIGQNENVFAWWPADVSVLLRSWLSKLGQALTSVLNFMFSIPKCK